LSRMVVARIEVSDAAELLFSTSMLLLSIIIREFFISLFLYVIIT